MASSVCTLFEGNYHYGVVALVNSLYTRGFRGPVFAGFRGTIPKWASYARENTLLAWPGALTLPVAKDMELHFLPVETEFHLTNYKPFFMLRLWEGLIKSADSLAYFDPDIVVKCKWEFYENWMSHGVGLVHEIRANDMPPTHPLRREWEKVIRLSGRETQRELHSYVNGGFCGVSKANTEFLHAWADIFTTGIEHFGLTPGQWSHSYDRTYLFYAQDQDALNIAAMCSESPISEMGPEAMDFIPGGSVMSHSVGSGKPWEKKYVYSAFKGYPPTMPDKLYWSNIHYPLSCFSSATVKSKRIAMLAASFIGRFYRRG